MGFGSIISSLVGVAAILLAAYVVISSGLIMTETITDSVMDMYQNNNEMLKTNINIDSVTTDGNNIYATVNNTGHEKIRDFKSIDIIVNYQPSTGDYITLWIPYTSKSPEPIEWTILNIEPDRINPGICDPRENMNIGIKLQNPVKNGNYNNWMQITTPNGISATQYFDR